MTEGAIKLPMTEFFDAFQAQLMAREVRVGPCRERETTLSDVPGYTQMHVVGNDPKADAAKLADWVADRCNGKPATFAWLHIPRRPWVEAADRIDKNDISIRLLAENDIRIDEIIMRADVLFNAIGDILP